LLLIFSFNIKAEEEELTLNLSPFSLQSQQYGGVSSSQTAFNPQISVIGDFVYTYSDLDEGSTWENGFDIREIELGFSASVDVYARADFFFAVSPDDDESGSEETGYSFSLEEGYITFLTFPFDLQVRLGKMRTSIGSVNQKHAHALNWFDYPEVLLSYFGVAGLVGTGGEISVLLPFSFYSELKYQVQKDNGGAYFNPEDEKEWYHNVRLSNFFELGEDHSLKIGIGYLSVESTFERSTADEQNETVKVIHNVYSADITYLWRPVRRALYKKFTFNAEVYFFTDDIDLTEDIYGFFAAIDHQFNQRWSFGIKYDYLQMPYSKNLRENFYTAYMTYIQSEFAFLRGGYTYVNGSDSSENRIFLQLNFGLGPHRAHKF
jgi:hypothetical protein